MRVLFLAMLAACGATDDVLGTWTGTCTMDATGWPDSVDLTLDITRDSAANVSGTGQLHHFSWDTAAESGDWSGEIDGTHQADRVVLDLDISFDGEDGGHAGQSLRLQIEGEKLENAIHGTCQLSGIPGTISLTR